MSRQDNPTQQLWLDLETTGLDPQSSVVVEVAAVLTHVTNNSLVVDHEMSFVVRPSPDQWTLYCAKMHMESGLVTEIESDKSVSFAEAFDHITTKVRMWAPKPRSVTLAGRSIHFDRTFLKRYAPVLEAYLHHRHLDMSTVEMFLQHVGINVEGPAAGNVKHRAMSDIQYALAEYNIYSDLVAPLRTRS